MQRWGNGVLAFGVVIYATGMALLVVQVVWGAALAQPLWLLPGLVILGFGQAMSMTPLLNLVLGLAKEEQAGMAAGVISTVQQVGGAMGIAASGAFFVPLLVGDAGAERYGQAFAGAMIYNLLAMLVAFVLLRWIIQQQRKVAL